MTGFVCGRCSETFDEIPANHRCRPRPAHRIEMIDCDTSEATFVQGFVVAEPGAGPVEVVVDGLRSSNNSPMFVGDDLLLDLKNVEHLDPPGDSDVKDNPTT